MERQVICIVEREYKTYWLEETRHIIRIQNFVSFFSPFNKIYGQGEENFDSLLCLICQVVDISIFYFFDLITWDFLFFFFFFFYALMIIELGISCIPTPTIATWAMPQPPNPNINYALHISKGVNRAQCKWVWDILSTRCLPLVVFSQGHIATSEKLFPKDSWTSIVALILLLMLVQRFFWGKMCSREINLFSLDSRIFSLICNLQSPLFLPL